MKKTKYPGPVYACSQWEENEKDRGLINTVLVFFSLSTIAVFAIPFIRSTVYAIIAITCCAAALISIFAVLVHLAIKKNRKRDLEVTTYNAYASGTEMPGGRVEDIGEDAEWDETL